MRLAAGTRLGPYEILGEAGAGGMGEVYRARDPRLGRIVAVKVIGSGLVHVPDLRQRFDQEGRLAAKLDHPRICAVYDVGHDRGLDYLVMEFLEGRSVENVLREGPLGGDQVVGLAIEIAAALAYAHAHGVVHRDLKPGNVILTPTGAKVIDFGLGIVRQAAQAPSSALAEMKTVPSPEGTSPTVPGTAPYVPPERLYGREADHRSDIFAFGAVVYEMATGHRAFEAANPADLIVAILTEEPPSMEAAGAPASELEWVIRRCLKKSPDDRWQSMADVEAVLKWIARGAKRSHAVQSSWRRRRMSVGLTAVAVASALVIGASFVAQSVERATPIAAPPVVAVTVPPPPDGAFTPTEGSVRSAQLAVSPDGHHLAFVGSGPDGVPGLWVRPIGSTTARSVPGTAHASYPFWSASSRSLGFFTPTELKRVDLDGGPATTLAAAPNGRGGTWSADDIIVFAPNAAGPLNRITATGDMVRQTALDGARGVISHRWPQFLPDGRHFIYFGRSTREEHQGIYLAALGSNDATLLVRSNFSAVFASPSRLLYVADDVLMSAALDVEKRRLAGDAVPIAQRIGASSNFYGAFSASTNGVLAYATNAVAAELTWIALDGRRLGLAAPRSGYADFRVSPDGRYVAVSEIDSSSDRPDIRLIDLLRGTNLRLTTSSATDASPAWSPDGKRIVFRSNRQGIHDLFLRSADGSGGDLPFLATGAAKYPTHWTRQTDEVIYHVNDERTLYDVWAAPVDHPERSRPLVHSQFNEMQGQVSPDGIWLAYTSDESSRFGVYVQLMREPGRKWPISVDGGSDPKWAANGRELFYVSPEGWLMAVPVRAGADLDPGRPRALFRLTGVSTAAPYLSSYDVDASGTRFLVRVPVEDVRTLPLNVLVDWPRRSASAR